MSELGGPTRSRTGLEGFAVLYITALTSDQRRRHTCDGSGDQPPLAQVVPITCKSLFA